MRWDFYNWLGVVAGDDEARVGCGVELLSWPSTATSAIRFFNPNLVSQRGIVPQMAVEFFHLPIHFSFFSQENAILDNFFRCLGIL
jgi:hypothetical protein